MKSNDKTNVMRVLGAIGFEDFEEFSDELKETGFLSRSRGRK